MEKFKTIALVVLSLALVIVSCLLVYQILITTNEPVVPIIKTDSVVITDTIYIKVPVEKIKYRDRKVVDTLYIPTTQDTTLLPFEEKHYQDSIADIYISGFQPNIDSINYHIPKQTIYIDKVVEVPQTKKWWEDRFVISAGFSAQYGLVHKQWDVGPYIGIGIRLGK